MDLQNNHLNVEDKNGNLDPRKQEEPEIIDLTGEEDDEVVIEHPDLKHIRSIHQKGEQYEVMPMEIDAFVDATQKLCKDWEVVFNLLHDLKATNDKLRHILILNEDGRNMRESDEILRTLEMNDQIYNHVVKLLPAVEAQKKKLFSL